MLASPSRGMQAVATARAMPSCGRGTLGTHLPGPCSSPRTGGAAGLAAAAAPDAAGGPLLAQVLQPRVVVEQQAAASPAPERRCASLTVPLQPAPATELRGSPAATTPVHAPVPPAFTPPQLDGLLARPDATCGPCAQSPGSPANAAPAAEGGAAPPTAAEAAAKQAAGLRNQVAPLVAPPPVVQQATSDQQGVAASLPAAEAVKFNAPSPASQCRIAERSKRAVLSQQSPAPCAMQIGVSTAAAPHTPSDPSRLPEQRTQPSTRSAVSRKQLAAAVHPEPSSASRPEPRNSARLAAKRSPMTAIATPAVRGSAPKAAAAGAGNTSTAQAPKPRRSERSAAGLSSLPSSDAAPCCAAAKATAEPVTARPPQSASSPAAEARSPQAADSLAGLGGGPASAPAHPGTPTDGACSPAPLPAATPPSECHTPQCGLNGLGCFRRPLAALVRSVRPDISRDAFCPLANLACALHWPCPTYTFILQQRC